MDYSSKNEQDLATLVEFLKGGCIWVSSLLDVHKFKKFKISYLNLKIESTLKINILFKGV